MHARLFGILARPRDRRPREERFAGDRLSILGQIREELRPGLLLPSLTAGVVIGGIVIAMYLPMFDLVSKIG